ncbi:zinc ribbon domain-containing protein [Candidatus Marinimicrobia bacterium MT.SAG.3]|nr:zinc ribbon domain-containing protein [Candidatus Marinimicrobia bacterium MT.SAG.3]
MPTYDYKCSNCGEIYELFQSMNDKPKKKCKSCGKNTAVRLIGGGSGLIFKGSGFYITDYKNKKPIESKSDKKETKKTDKVSTGKETAKSNSTAKSASGD